LGANRTAERYSALTMLGLTHYTSSLTAIENILANGFAWVPNERKLIQQFVPEHDFSRREPQKFGMISFTDSEPPAPLAHRNRFGQFGVVVAREWAQSQMAQRVLYVPAEGPVAETLRWLFTCGYEQLKAVMRYPGDAAAEMAFTNKAMAEVEGALLWSKLLTLYEYLEPEKNACQSEWRIVQPLPLYGYPSSTEEIIRAVSPPQNWAKFTKVLRAPDDAIIGFVCPSREEESFMKVLPAHFASRAIELYEG
jgi:hypothetical protein